eukprot:Nitzschia sp. Nitz4//scaffold186_size43309//32506//33180//NITZ4_007323-RA/size43309-processed-gene-0.8-mRNA-1//-1//CDS//3329539776//3403//frame0
MTATTIPTEGVPEPTVEWILWKHCWNSGHFQSGEEWTTNTNEMSHFFAHPTQEAFHMDLHHLPQPSTNFFLKSTRNTLGEHRAGMNHTEYSLFQKGVRPAWEDPNCAGQLYVKHYFPPQLLDAYWHKLAHGVMEGMIDHKYVLGIRIVDKSKGKHPMYKLELWLNTTDPKIRGVIRKQALACVPQDDHYRFNFHWREFPEPGAPNAEADAGSVDAEVVVDVPAN